MRFDSKIDWWFHVIVITTTASMIGLGVWTVLTKSLLTGIGCILFSITDIALIFPIWLNTSYRLTETSLVIKSGLFAPIKIPYRKIISITKASSPLISLALSANCLKIKFRRSKRANFVYISPVNQDEFIRQLNSRRE